MYIILIIERLISKTKKTFFSNLPHLLIAAVVLFSLFLIVQDKYVFALFGTRNKEQSLIIEESLRAKFQEVEGRLLKEGSFVYGFGYGFSNPMGNLDDGFGGGEFTGNVLIQGIAFLGSSNPSSNLASKGIFDRQRSGIITYEVQAGDVPSYIAASFGISTNTLLWANDLSYWSIIKPGQKLVILPASGVLHEVKKGETLDSIVKKYKGDFNKTIAYNGLPADAAIKVAQEIIILDGEKAVVSRPSTTSTYQATQYLGPYGSKSRQFPWGQCTWYVAQKRYVPWNGHAKAWLSNARKYGFQTGTEPRVGAIMATNETWYGHVAYVEAVNGDYITVSEMYGIPYWKKGKLATRTFNKNDWRIKGYIY